MGLGLGIIPLSATVSYQGISGVNPHAIAATSLGGATGLGIGNYLSSNPRQVIYASAANAITCAIGATAPYNIEPKGAGDLRTSLEALPGKIEELRKQDCEQGEQAQADALIGDALGLLSAARKVAQAPAALVNAVDLILATANKQIIATLPDPQQLASGLGGLIPLPTSPLGAKDTSAKQAEERAKGERCLTACGNAIDALKGNVEVIRAHIGGIDHEAAKKALATCGVDLSNLPSPIKLGLGSSRLAMTLTDERRIPVTGGKKAADKGYYAIVTNPPPLDAGGSFKAEIVFDSIWFLKLTADKVKDGRAEVLVRDDSENAPALLVIAFQSPPAVTPTRVKHQKKVRREGVANR